MVSCELIFLVMVSVFLCISWSSFLVSFVLCWILLWWVCRILIGIVLNWFIVDIFGLKFRVVEKVFVLVCDLFGIGSCYKIVIIGNLFVFHLDMKYCVYWKFFYFDWVFVVQVDEYLVG